MRNVHPAAVTLVIATTLLAAAIIPLVAATGNCTAGRSIGWGSLNPGTAPETRHSAADLVPNVMQVRETAPNSNLKVDVYRQSTVAGSCNHAETLTVGLQGSLPIAQGVNEYVGLVITTSLSGADYQIVKTAT